MRGPQRTSILVVEDDPEVAQVLRGRLESKGYETHIETTGESALNYAAKQGPDLVLLDVSLPDMSGLQVSKQLRKLYSRRELPIVMLTAKDQPVDQLYGFAHGADAYLTKPYNPSELTQTIKLCLGEIVGDGGPYQQ